MVDAQTLQTISVTIAAGGFVLALAYYVLILRNTIRTRQAQLFMELYGQFRSKDFQEMANDILEFEFKDEADFIRKYGRNTNPEAYVKFYSVMAFYEGMGVLIRRNLINPILVDDMMSGPTMEMWGKFGQWSLRPENDTIDLHRGSSLNISIMRLRRLLRDSMVVNLRIGLKYNGRTLHVTQTSPYSYPRFQLMKS